MMAMIALLRNHSIHQIILIIVQGLHPVPHPPIQIQINLDQITPILGEELRESADIVVMIGLGILQIP